MSDYREDLAAMRMARAEQVRNEVAREILDHEAERLNAEQRAHEALAAGDRTGAAWFLDDAAHAEAAINEASARLTQIEQQLPPQDGLTDAKRQWLTRRQDLVNPQSIEAAGNWHRHITQNMGVTDDSDQYFELMSHVLEPGGDYQPAPTPDDIVAACGIDADTYNEGVVRLAKLKAAGGYPDK